MPTSTGVRALTAAVLAGDYQRAREALDEEAESLQRAGYREPRVEAFIARSSIGRAIPGPSPLDRVDSGDLVA